MRGDEGSCGRGQLPSPQLPAAMAQNATSRASPPQSAVEAAIERVLFSAEARGLPLRLHTGSGANTYDAMIAGADYFLVTAGEADAICDQHLHPFLAPRRSYHTHTHHHR
eukprot:3349280-Pleurochrysis_carterae.AAC.2